MGLGVMAGWAQGGEPHPLAAGQERLRQRARPAGRVQRGVPGAGAQRGVEIELATAGAQLAHRLHVLRRMHPQELLHLRGRGLPRLEPHPVPLRQGALHGLDALRALGVAVTRVVLERGGMSKEDRHSRRYRTDAQ